jgi:tetratricopeptide (TPR) repeat protein
VKRVFAAVVLLLTAVALVYGYTVTRREQAYRQHIDRGEAALARDDTFAAIEAFSAAIGIKSESMIGYLKRGETYRRRDELESALRKPAHVEPLASRPSLDAALRDLRRATEIDPLAPRPHELLGDINYAMDRFDRAAERYQRYVTLDDRSPRILYKLGLAYYAGGNPQAALAALGKAVAIDDRFAEAYYLTGLCARDLRQADRALAALERSVQLAPAMLQAREELANLYGRRGRAGDRIAMLEALRALDATASREVTLGLAYARSGRTEDAVNSLGRAVEAYPDHAYTYIALGRVWLEIAQARRDRVALSKALEALEGAVVGSDSSSEALTLFGRALLLGEDEELAERMLQQATEKLPVDPLAFFYLAEAAERAGHFDVARAALLDHQALEGEDDDARGRAMFAARIASYSSRLGEHATAVSWYQRAVDAGANDTPLLVSLAEVQARAGDLTAARATIARAVEKDPASRAARNLQRRLRK